MKTLKARVIDEICTRLEAERASLLESARVAHEAATHEESRAEDQYDTRGLEAAYLAGAQAKRSEELQRTVLYFRSNALAEAKLAQVEVDGRSEFFLIARSGGGIRVDLDGKRVLVITADSPLGGELVAARVGDEVEVEVRGVSRNYAVQSIE